MWTQEAYHAPQSKCSLCCSVWGVPHPNLARRIPHPDLSRGGYPSPILARGYPSPGWGTPPERTKDKWHGKETGTGVPPPGSEQTDTCENSTFPILRMRAVASFCLELLVLWRLIIAWQILDPFTHFCDVDIQWRFSIRLFFTKGSILYSIEFHKISVFSPKVCQRLDKRTDFFSFSEIFEVISYNL